MDTTEDPTSPRMAQLVKSLALKHQVNLAVRGACLILAMPDRTERWMIYHYDDGRVSVTRFLVFEDRSFALDLDLVFEIHPLGWEPVELIYDPDFWQAYLQAAEAEGSAAYDEYGQTRFAGFTEYVARQIEAEGWPEQSHQQIADGWSRLPGCQSTNHDFCYGVLWQCSDCGKTVCYAEGTDDYRELCDDCWASKHHVPASAFNQEES
jgi:hypothetical protein